MIEGLEAYAQEQGDVEVQRASLWLGQWREVRELAASVLQALCAGIPQETRTFDDADPRLSIDSGGRDLDDGLGDDYGVDDIEE